MNIKKITSLSNGLVLSVCCTLSNPNYKNNAIENYFAKSFKLSSSDMLSDKCQGGVVKGVAKNIYKALNVHRGRVAGEKNRSERIDGGLYENI